jgi:hypothetical protein
MADHIVTFHEGGAWHNRIDGEKGVTGPFRTKEQAIEAAHREAHRAKWEHIVRGENGEIEERHSH